MIPPVAPHQRAVDVSLARQADTGREEGDMSRHLPARPNLEYLKKDAKELLERLQQRDAATQLADAQHALAQEYGFPSWPKLKAHVESLSPFAGAWTANFA